MDRSLWLLWALRCWSTVRRWFRGLRTVKGMVLGLVGSLAFLPVLISGLLSPSLPFTPQHEAVRRYGPFVLLGYCLINFALSAGERILYYSPAEVDFLFPAPYRPRQLLLYRIVGSVMGSLGTALFLTALSAQHFVRPFPAFVGLSLVFEFCYLFVLVIGLLGTTVAVMAFNRRRKLALLAIGLFAAALLVEQGRGLRGTNVRTLLVSVEHSPLVQVIIAPFRPFAMLLAAERIWPDVPAWGAIALAIDCILVIVALALDARHYEAAAVSSARIYQQLQRARRGSWTTPGRARISLPGFPWWGGIGPNFWRQATAATRGLPRLTGFLLMVLAPAGTGYLASYSPDFDASAFGAAAYGMLATIALFAPSMVTFDFRADIHRIEDLKCLPIRPARLVAGQVLTPILIVVAGEWLSAGLIGRFAGNDVRLLGTTLALIVPFSVLLVGIENLGFLLYPARATPGGGVEFQIIGRQLLLGMAKLIVVGAVSGVVAAVGAGAFFLTGGSWAAALAGAWITVAAGAAAFLPMLAMAFARFDVARDTPD